MANFIEDGGMLCSFSPGSQKADGADTDMSKGLWQGDFQNVLADFSEDERCHVGLFGTGNSWGAGCERRRDSSWRGRGGGERRGQVTGGAHPFVRRGTPRVTATPHP